MRGKLLTIVSAFIVVLALSSGANAQKEAHAATASDSGIIAISAAIAIGMCALGAGYGIAKAGSAAMGAIAEKPESATWGLIIVALAEGVALYGLIIAFLLVTKL